MRPESSDLDDAYGLPEQPAGRDVTLGVSDFVAVFNQSLEFTFPSVTVVGELANFRVSKNRWVYFDLKDELSSVKCFGTVYQLSGLLEDGMLLRVQAAPRLHNLYGLSLNVQHIRPSGAGTIRRAAQLLEAALQAEGLFDAARKRALPYPPRRIGLVTSGESAAYADFIKILGARWGGIAVELVDVQVQGDPAPGQIVAAIEQLNAQAVPPDVLVVIRGGGSAEDLQAFSTEQVTRAVAASRVPTLVAIGHEIDVSLAELAADVRASTPSNAAELLTPDKAAAKSQLAASREQLQQAVTVFLRSEKDELQHLRQTLHGTILQRLQDDHAALENRRQLLEALNPQAILRRGYAIVRSGSQVIRSVQQLRPDATITVTFGDGTIAAEVTKGDQR